MQILQKGIIWKQGLAKKREKKCFLIVCCEQYGTLLGHYYIGISYFSLYFLFIYLNNV